MNLNETPRANRIHIGLYGKRNSGKSSIINALTGQQVAIVSDYAGTTTDPVYKAMELHPVGPVVFIDTAGFDDEGEIGKLRIEKTTEAVKKTDIAILVFSSSSLLAPCSADEGRFESQCRAEFCMEEIFSLEMEWYKTLKDKKIPVICVLNKSDLLNAEQTKILVDLIRDKFETSPVVISAENKLGIDKLKDRLVRNLPENYEMKSITGDLVKKGDVVMLVMPQDIQAPKGRLILPQVQTLRDLLDKGCTPICTTVENLEHSLESLKEAPQLIITDSQCFSVVYEKKPKESLLTSFSILFAGYKGDIETFVMGAQAIKNLSEDSKVLIAEACTHAPLEEDIGRVKIPNALKKNVGNNLHVDIVAGQDFPSDLSQYDLVIHCGGCMFNRKYMMSRIENAEAQGVPITNYGVTMAYLTGILDKISF